MANLDLNDRNAIKALMAEARQEFAASNAVAVPNNFAQRATRLFRGLGEAGVELDAAEVKAQATGALEAAKGGAHFVNSWMAVKNLDKFVAPHRPAPVEPEAEEGEGEEG